MPHVMMNDPVTGRVAVFLENGTAGDPEDPNSSRNAPLNNPVAHLSKVRFHNEFDYYQVHSITDVVANHPSVAGASATIATTPTFTRYGRVAKASIDLLFHGLPYVPAYMIASGGVLIGQSSKIQADANGQRMVSPYATNEVIRLLDVAIVGGTATLAGFPKAYQVIVFKNPVATSPWMADIDPAAGVFELGYGKWNGGLRQLRRTMSGDASPFDVPLGRTTDVRGGGSRTVLADGTGQTSPFYTGGFSGSPSTECTVE